jgi:hypothetical protein
MATPDRFEFEFAPSALRGPNTGAAFSPCRRYRYALWRMWAPEKPYINFILLNPPTADETANDPTIERQVRRVQGWERKDQMSAWKAGGIVVTNAYAWRATDPTALKRLRSTGLDPIGPDNTRALVTVATGAALVICGWGNHCDDVIPGRGAANEALLRSAGVTPHALGVNKDGSPQHPLYLPYDRAPEVML